MLCKKGILNSFIYIFEALIMIDVEKQISTFKYDWFCATEKFPSQKV